VRTPAEARAVLVRILSHFMNLSTVHHDICDLHAEFRNRASCHLFVMFIPTFIRHSVLLFLGSLTPRLVVRLAQVGVSLIGLFFQSGVT